MNDIDYECGDGWRNLIDAALDQIRATDHRIQITQVKSRKGGLRIHYGPHNERADFIVKIAEEIASQTCEICGSGNARTQPVKHLWKTLCAKCVSMEKHN